MKMRILQGVWTNLSQAPDVIAIGESLSIIPSTDDVFFALSETEPTAGTVLEKSKATGFRLSSDSLVDLWVFSTAGSNLNINSTGASDFYSTAGVNSDALGSGNSGYEFTGGFIERTTGSAGANDLGTNVQYTAAQATAGIWKRFGFNPARQIANDVEYWGETDPAFDQTKGLFGGLHMPEGVTDLINYSDTSHQAAATTGSLLYTDAVGSYDMTQCKIGDRIQVRFSFNAVPQVANSTLEVGLIWATRDAQDNVTFTFPLTTQPIFFGTGSQGAGYLNRVEMSAYIASDEDLNARALPAIRCNNEILIQPLSTLITVVR